MSGRDNIYIASEGPCSHRDLSGTLHLCTVRCMISYSGFCLINFALPCYLPTLLSVSNKERQPTGRTYRYFNWINIFHLTRSGFSGPFLINNVVFL